MGYNQFAGIGKETTWGTAVARSQFFRIFDGSVLDHEIQQTPRTQFRSRDPEGLFKTRELGRATLKVPMAYNGMGKLWEACFGKVVDAGAGPYTHSFTSEANPYTRTSAPLIGLTVEEFLDLPDASLESMRMTGGRVTGFGFEFRPDVEPMLDVSLIGKQTTQVVKTASPTFPTDADLVHPAQVTMTLDGTAIVCDSFAVRVNNNLRERVPLGTQFVDAALGQGKREVTGSFSRDWTTGTKQGKAVWDAFLAGTDMALIVIATGPSSQVLQFELGTIRITGKAPAPVEGEFNRQEVEFTALDDSGTTIFKLTETNNVATT